MTRHHNQHLLPDGWTPPPRPRPSPLATITALAAIAAALTGHAYLLTTHWPTVAIGLTAGATGTIFLHTIERLTGPPLP